MEYVHKLTISDGREWIRNVKVMLLDVRELEALEWIPKLSFRETIQLYRIL